MFIRKCKHLTELNLMEGNRPETSVSRSMQLQNPNLEMFCQHNEKAMAICFSTGSFSQFICNFIPSHEHRQTVTRYKSKDGYTGIRSCFSNQKQKQ